MKKISNLIHKVVLLLATDVGVFAFAAFMMAFFAGMDQFVLTTEQLALLRQYVFIPWGTALCIYRMYVVKGRTDAVRAEIWVLFVLWLWLFAPFAIRFGATARNVGVWHGYGVMFFALYALIAEAPEGRRETIFDHATLLFAALGWVLGVTLLYCAVTVRSFKAEWGNYVYGVYLGKHLVSGHYYNTTGLIALYTALMCLAGANRRRGVAAKALYLIPAAMMIVVNVLTQSRTSRYALIAALAVGAYGAAGSLLKGRHMLVRQGAAMVLGAVVLVSGYVGADWLTGKALEHYVTVEAQRSASAAAIAPPVTVAQRMQRALIADAVAEDAEAGEPKKTAAEIVANSNLKRDGGDATFTGRTKIWENAISIWKETPKYMLIGVGAGNSGVLLAKGNYFELLGGVDAHNAFIQIAVDFGLIGLALLLVFMAMIVPPALRVFYKDTWKNGYGVMAMVVVAALLVGLMESDPFGALTLSGTTLFFALAMLTSRGREMTQSGNR